MIRQALFVEVAMNGRLQMRSQDRVSKRAFVAFLANERARVTINVVLL
jgi:hypothetical protein